VRPRAAAGRAAGQGPRQLDPEVYARARAAAPGLDPYGLEAEWRARAGARRPAPGWDPEADFLAFVARRARGAAE
jgi:hypothetical protein